MSKTKTFSSETSQRYSLALYELCKENSELDKVEHNVKLFLKIYTSNLEFENFLKNPTTLKIEQINGLKILSEKLKFVKTFSNFLQFLITKRRIFFVKKILDSFLKLLDKNRGQIKAILTSARPLSDSEIKKISDDFSKILNTSLKFKFDLDETLIGGIKIQVGSLMIDTTIKNRLKNYENIMLEQ